MAAEINIENRIISKIINEQSLREIHKLGISASHFNNLSDREAFSTIIDYDKRHGEVPTLAALKKDLPNYKVYAVKEPWSFLTEKLLAAFRTKVVENSLDDFVSYWDKGDESRFRLEYTKIGTALDLKTFNDSQANINEEGDDERILRELLEERSRMEDRMTSGLDELDKAVGGIRGDDTVVISGLPGDGKSALLMHMADAVLNQGGKRVLYFTFEMSVSEVSNRWLARRSTNNLNKLLPNININPEGRDDLSKHEMSDLKGATEFLFGEESGLSIVELDLSTATYSGIKTHINRFNPDIVFIDGAYMIKDESGKDTQTLQISELLRDLRLFTISNRIPVILTTQALRSKLAAGGISASSIGYSSSWEQYATIYFGIHRAEDQPTQQQIRMFKLRNGFISQDDSPIITWHWESFQSWNRNKVPRKYLGS